MSGQTTLSGWCSGHDPVTGERGLSGSWLPGPLGSEIGRWAKAERLDGLSRQWPEVYHRLGALLADLESETRVPVQFEFESDAQGVCVLRVRSARLPPHAHIVAVHDLARRNVISVAEAVLAVSPAQAEAGLTPTIDLSSCELLGEGLGVSMGTGSGLAVFTAEEAARAGVDGEQCILVVEDLRPEDVTVSESLAGVITLRGGATSHAAVVAKGLGLPMIAGVRDASLDRDSGLLHVDGHTVGRLDPITVDGNTGSFYAGKPSPVRDSVPEALAELVTWADEFSVMRVYANADSGQAAQTAARLGATGIGLCRMEHVLAANGMNSYLGRLTEEDDPARRAVLIREISQTLTRCLSDVIAAIGQKVVTIRLLDVPRHELPAASAPEVNPMMGFRGVREFLLIQDLAVAQVRAIARACRTAEGFTELSRVQILVPMISFTEEFRRARRVIEQVLTDEIGAGSPMPAIGCMIEVPRAALCAAELAAEADFLSIGSNDLTQFVLAASRDDGQASFLRRYRDDHVIDQDPFVALDEHGVGQLIRMCAEQARARRPDMPIGICGDHAGDPSSLQALVSSGLNYVSCVPQRVPLARFVLGRAGLASGHRG